MLKAIIAVGAFLALSGIAYACTTIAISGKDGTVTYCTMCCGPDGKNCVTVCN